LGIQISISIKETLRCFALGSKTLNKLGPTSSASNSITSKHNLEFQ